MCKKKVLIVEDEYLVSYLLESYVNDSDCSSVIGTVDNGEDAINFVEKQKPDCILMDVRIDGNQDGIETAHKINAKYSIPIIYTSGNTDEKTTERAKQTNMLAFLPKPVVKEQLQKIICSIS